MSDFGFQVSDFRFRVNLVPTGHDVHWAASSESEYVPAVQSSHAPADANVPALHVTGGSGFRVSGYGLRVTGYGLRVAGYGLRATGWGLALGAVDEAVGVTGYELRGSGLGVEG